MALTKEDLAAIRSLMEESIEANNEKIYSVMDANNEKIYRAMDARLEATKKEILRGVNVVVENKYQEILKLLREDYGRLAATADSVRDYGEVKSMVSGHDRALKSHHTRIDALEKKAIR